MYEIFHERFLCECKVTLKKRYKQKKNRKYLRVLWKKVNFAEQKNLFDVAKQPNYKLWVKESRN